MKKRLVQLILGMGLVLFTHTVSAQWVQTNGLLGMDIRALAASDSIILAGTLGGEVFLSANNGASWNRIDSGLIFSTVKSFAVSGSTIFVGTIGGVFRSTDNGARWTGVDSGLIAHSILSLAVSGNTIFAGTDSGVFRSINNGESWTKIDSGLTNPAVNFLAVNGSSIFAGTLSGGSFSTDNGTSWNAVDSGPMNDQIATLAVSGSNIFSVTQSWGGSGVWLSTDNGTSWTLPAGLNSGLPRYTYFRSLIFSGGTLLAGTNYGVFFFNNNATSWTDFNSGFLIDKHVAALAVSGSNIFAGASTNGVWRKPLSELTEAIVARPPRTTARQIYFKVRSPDPANRIVSIEYSLPHSDRVTVKIYNTFGDEIATLVDTDQESGAYAIPWKTLNRAPGWYMVKMHSGPNTYVKCIPVLR
jgi:hypothetical protein